MKGTICDIYKVIGQRKLIVVADFMEGKHRNKKHKYKYNDYISAEYLKKY
jgi:hypothetical protein